MAREGRVVLWGGRADDVQFGDPRDVKREQAREVFDELLVALSRRVALVGLTLGMTVAEINAALREFAEAGVSVRRRG